MTNYEVERFKNLILSMYVDVYDDYDRYYNKALYDVIGKIGDADDIERAIADGTPYEERPQGKWIDIYSSHIAYMCSNCGLQTPICDYYHFCPNCGTEMTKEGEE